MKECDYVSSKKREDMLQKFQVQILIGSTNKLTEMIAKFNLSLYNYKITEPKLVQSINLSKHR